MLDELARIAPVYAVRGNIDTRARDLPDALVLDVASTSPLRILLTHIAVYGPKLRAPVARMAKAEGATLVVCGHSHVPFIGVDRGIIMFNPGSVGPRRFTLPIVFGTVDVTPSGVKLVRVDLNTGLRAGPNSTKVITEAFKPGTAPPDTYSVVGFTAPDGTPIGVSPDADRAVRTGGGLY